jgi:hypothetical protein
VMTIVLPPVWSWMLTMGRGRARTDDSIPAGARRPTFLRDVAAQLHRSALQRAIGLL